MHFSLESGQQPEKRPRQKISAEEKQRRKDQEEQRKKREKEIEAEKKRVADDKMVRISSCFWDFFVCWCA